MPLVRFKGYRPNNIVPIAAANARTASDNPLTLTERSVPMRFDVQGKRDDLCML